jgi:predicted transcriptional regulator
MWFGLNMPTIHVTRSGGPFYGQQIQQSRTELKILDALAENLNGFTWTTLREKTRISKAVMADAVKRLKEPGFIEQREQQYVITKKGEERRHVLRKHLKDSIPSTSAMIIFNSSAEDSVSFAGSAQFGRKKRVKRSQLEVETERKKLEEDLKNYSKQLSSSLTKGVPGFETATIIISIKKEKEGE